MTDTTVTNDSPQTQPGPDRTADGTIKDASPGPLGNTTPSDGTKPVPSSDGGGSFLTAKPDDKKPDTTPEPTKPDDKKPDDAPQGAPEKYADFKLPEGFKPDTKIMGEAIELFKAMNLSQEQAQQLIDFQAKNFTAAAEAPYKLWADTQKEWLGDIQDRFGSKADAVRTDINKAITNALPPSLARSFRAALDLTGAGTHPDVVEALSILTKSLVEGVPVRGNGPVVPKAPGAPERPSAAEAMYPHLVQNRPQ